MCAFFSFATCDEVKSLVSLERCSLISIISSEEKSQKNDIVLYLSCSYHPILIISRQQHPSPFLIVVDRNRKQVLRMLDIYIYIYIHTCLYVGGKLRDIRRVEAWRKDKLFFLLSLDAHWQICTKSRHFLFSFWILLFCRVLDA